jgi:hypothetical protein
MEQQQNRFPAGATKLSREEMKAIQGGNQWFVICTLSNHLGCYYTEQACEADCPQPSNCRWNDGCPANLPPGDWTW